MRPHCPICIYEYKYNTCITNDAVCCECQFIMKRVFIFNPHLSPNELLIHSRSAYIQKFIYFQCLSCLHPICKTSLLINDLDLSYCKPCLVKHILKSNLNQ